MGFIIALIIVIFMLYNSIEEIVTNLKVKNKTAKNYRDIFLCCCTLYFCYWLMSLF